MVSKRTPLRAVADGDEPSPAPPKTIAEAAERGDELAQAKLTRLAIARKLDDPDCQSRDMASLSKRLMELGREISALEAREAEEAVRRDVSPDEKWSAEAL